MCLSEIYNKEYINEYLSDSFLIQNGINQGDALSPMLFNVENDVFWDVTPCGSCKNRSFGGNWRLLHQGDKNR
jgi:hypothetical protein